MAQWHYAIYDISPVGGLEVFKSLQHTPHHSEPLETLDPLLGSALNKQLKFIYVILCIFRHNNKNIKSAKGGGSKQPLTAAAAVGFWFAFVIVCCHTKSFLWVPWAKLLHFYCATNCCKYLRNVELLTLFSLLIILVGPSPNSHKAGHKND